MLKEEDNGKYTLDDFSTIDTIDLLLSFLKKNYNDIDKIDVNGYTPMGFAAYSNLKPWVFVHLMNSGVSSMKLSSKFNMSPLQLAGVNLNTISALTSVGAVQIDYIPITKYKIVLTKRPSKCILTIRGESVSSELYSIKYCICKRTLFIEFYEEPELQPRVIIDGIEKDLEPVIPFIKVSSADYLSKVTENDILYISKINSSSCLKAILDIYARDSEHNVTVDSDGKRYIRFSMTIDEIQDHQGDVLFLDSSGYSPLFLATMISCYEAVNLLLDMDDLEYVKQHIITQCDGNGMSALEIAASYNDTGLVELFLSKLDDSISNILLNVIIQNSMINTFTYLISKDSYTANDDTFGDAVTFALQNALADAILVLVKKPDFDLQDQNKLSIANDILNYIYEEDMEESDSSETWIEIRNYLDSIINTN